MELTICSISKTFLTNYRASMLGGLQLKSFKKSSIGTACRVFASARDDLSVHDFETQLNRKENCLPTNCPSIQTTLEPSEQVIACLSEDNQRKLKKLVIEREEYRQKGYPIPLRMTDEQWLDILVSPTPSQRRKLYQFLRKKEILVFRRKIKKTEARVDNVLRLLAPREPPVIHDAGAIQYGLNKNSIFRMIHVSQMNTHFNHWQCHGVLFGQNIVLDLDYDDTMTDRECKNCAKQITHMYSANRVNREPFHFHLCNARSGDATYETLLSYFPNLHQPTNLISVHRECYRDVFPREKLIYLTPHCDEVLTRYDHDAVYVIGGIVDKAVPKPLTFEKAQMQGIQMAKLPLDNYLEWKPGRGKLLTLDQMMKIMLDIKNTGDWVNAFTHIPRRKLKSDNEKCHQFTKAAYLRERNRKFFISEDLKNDLLLVNN